MVKATATIFKDSAPTLLLNTDKVHEGAPTKPQGLYSRLAYGTANCVKRFGLGIAAGSIIRLMSDEVAYLAHGMVIPKSKDVCYYSIQAKISSINKILFGSPIEEIFFRGLMQDVLLTRIPKYVIKNIVPGREIALDSSVAKTARIVLTAAAFSTCHLLNQGLFPDSALINQLTLTFVSGICFGIIKESKMGMLGSVGAHMSINFFAVPLELWSC